MQTTELRFPGTIIFPWFSVLNVPFCDMVQWFFHKVTFSCTDVTVQLSLISLYDFFSFNSIINFSSLFDLLNMTAVILISLDTISRMTCEVSRNSMGM